MQVNNYNISILNIKLGTGKEECRILTSRPAGYGVNQRKRL